jgi:hypothetical protein
LSSMKHLRNDGVWCRAFSLRAALLLLVLTVPLPAQTIHRSQTGVGIGLAVQSDSRRGYQSPLGPALIALRTWRFAPALGARVRTVIARFEKMSPGNGDFAPCANPLVTCDPPPPVGPLTVAGASASAILFDVQKTRTGRGAYYVFSATSYGPLQHPDGVHPLRFGWGMGLGFDLGMAGRPAVLELQYDRVRGFNNQYFALVPVTIALVW